MLPSCRTCRFYLTEDGRLAEEVCSNEEVETIIRERVEDKLLLTYTHNNISWTRIFEPATVEDFKNNIC